MQLRRIRQISVLATVLFVAAILALFGAVVTTKVHSDMLFGLSMGTWATAFGGCLLLRFILHRVRCPECGRLFNRPDYPNWVARHFSKTYLHWSCVHCRHGARKR